jgi:SAM-dependent methyltransferase
VLAERYEYLGVDLSPVQIERSRAAMPGARFELADATSLELEAATIEGIVSLFMLGHVPRAEQASLLQRIAAWLRPGGWLLATMGTAAAEDEVDPDWLGAPMFFASFDEPTNHCLLRDAGLDAVEARSSPSRSPGTAWCASCGCSPRSHTLGTKPTHTGDDFAGTVETGG